MLLAGKHTGFLARLAVATAVLIGVLGVAWGGLLAPLDQALREIRFLATNRAPSGETLFVDIDAASLASIGVWPWPRQVHADVLDRLMALGAAEVVFDIDFSTTSAPAGDLALEQALERAGGYAWLAAFQQVAADGTVVLNAPLDRFATFAEPVLVNVDGDGTQLLRSVPTGLPERGIRSVAAALVPEFPHSGSSIFIDYGIDLNSIQRMPVAQLLHGNPDPELLRGKQVVVGASAVELRDFFRVPRFGVIPGPLVQLAATETLKAGRPLVGLGFGPAMSLAVLAAALLVLARARMTLANAAWAGLGSMVVVEGAAWLALRDGRITLDSAPFHLCIVLLLLAAVLHERAMHWREIFRQQARLAYLANHDPVTGALSRAALLDQLDSQLADRPASIIMVQLGRLDAAIAALGHEVGDRVALDVARRIEQHLGSMPARIASDIFAWRHPAALDAAQQLGLCRQASQWLDRPYAVEGHSIVLDTRFGSSAGAPHTPARELLRQADVALTQARMENVKALAYSPEQSALINQRRLLDINLRMALERGEFFLLYQPQIDLATGAMIGVEALVRWKSESLGLVSPADFIPLAEETGLIVELGEWILLEACNQAAGWDWHGRLSVNVSSIQFRMGDVVASVRAALETSRFPASRLDLELTESLFVDNDPAIHIALETLRHMGIGIALDDFGTGYSSLSYLSRLPIDKLKIDQSFIRPLPEKHNEAIVETILLMARRLGKTVVAEGVETPEQRDYLAALGCQVGQGYLFSRPAPAENIGLLPRQIVAA